MAKLHSEQWRLDLSSFLPEEECFTEVQVTFLLMSKDPLTRACFCLKIDDWVWGPDCAHLLPVVIEHVHGVRREVQGKIYEGLTVNLDRKLLFLHDLGAGDRDG